MSWKEFEKARKVAEMLRKCGRNECKGCDFEKKVEGYKECETDLMLSGAAMLNKACDVIEKRDADERESQKTESLARRLLCYLFAVVAGMMLVRSVIRADALAIAYYAILTPLSVLNGRAVK